MFRFIVIASVIVAIVSAAPKPQAGVSASASAPGGYSQYIPAMNAGASGSGSMGGMGQMGGMFDWSQFMPPNMGGFGAGAATGPQTGVQVAVDPQDAPVARAKRSPQLELVNGLLNTATKPLQNIMEGAAGGPLGMLG